MGGAAGHLQHLYENRDLTFAEIKDIIRRASEGRLEHVTEKLDGMNLVFTWDARLGELRVARNAGDITKGGMDAAALATKFYGRGSVEQAFTSAFKVLKDAISALPDRTKQWVFGHAGQVWYSLEVIYAVDPNVINYDSNCIVFHGWPVFQVTDYGIDQLEDAPGIELLTQHIDRMQKAVTLKDWRVKGPSVLRMQRMANGSVTQAAIQAIAQAQAQCGAHDTDTLQTYIMLMMQPEVARLKLPPKAAAALLHRASSVPGAPTVNDIKKLVPKQQQETVAAFARQSETLQKRFIQPIEQALFRFSIEVLRGLHSTLVSHSDNEVQRLRAQVATVIKAIEASGNEAAMEVLQREMQRLGTVDNITAAMEGIVFIYKGQAYKFTGAFAPAHQILALFKYGRKGIPKLSS